MAIIISKVIVDGEHEFDIGNYEQNFGQVLILSDDLNLVKGVFKNFTYMEIIKNGMKIFESSAYNTYSSIEYMDSLWIPEREIMTPALRVTLTKVNIEEMVDRLKEIVEPTIDFDTMTVEEYKKYKLKQISQECTADIYDGGDVILSDGTSEHFSYDEKDQIDLLNLANIAMTMPTLELSWHSDSNYCKFYSGYDIIRIYVTLQTKLIRAATTANVINMLLKDATTKDEVDKYYYGCKLSKEAQDRVDSIMEGMMETINKIIEKIPAPAPTAETQE